MTDPAGGRGGTGGGDGNSRAGPAAAPRQTAAQNVTPPYKIYAEVLIGTLPAALIEF